MELRLRLRLARGDGWGARGRVQRWACGSCGQGPWPISRGARGHLVDLQAVPEQDARLGQVVAPDCLLRAAEQRDDLLPFGGGARQRCAAAVPPSRAWREPCQLHRTGAGTGSRPLACRLQGGQQLARLVTTLHFARLLLWWLGAGRSAAARRRGTRRRVTRVQVRARRPARHQRADGQDRGRQHERHLN